MSPARVCRQRSACPATSRSPTTAGGPASIATSRQVPPATSSTLTATISAARQGTSTTSRDRFRPTAVTALPQKMPQTRSTTSIRPAGRATKPQWRAGRRLRCLPPHLGSPDCDDSNSWRLTLDGAHAKVECVKYIQVCSAGLGCGAAVPPDPCGMGRPARPKPNAWQTRSTTKRFSLGAPCPHHLHVQPPSSPQRWCATVTRMHTSSVHRGLRGLHPTSFKGGTFDRYPTPRAHRTARGDRRVPPQQPVPPRRPEQ
jgi:hypothetical protein